MNARKTKDEMIEEAADKLIAGQPLTRAEQRLLDSPQGDFAMAQVRAALVTFTTQPSQNGADWYVWDMREALPPKPVFFGAMEDAGLVAAALNRREMKRWHILK